MNIDYLYEQEYYKGLINAQLSEKCKLENTQMFDAKVAEVNHFIKDSKYEATKEIIPFCEQSFLMKTVYPGLLLGIGAMHSAKTGNEETKLGFSIDYVTGLPIIPGSTIKGLLRSVFINHPDYVVSCLATTQIESETILKKIELEIFGDRHPFDSSKEIEQNENELGIDIFFDALPVYPDKNGHIYGFDYITPHKAEDGMDGLKNPVPLKMLKVMPEVTFLFRFQLRESKILSVNQKLKLFQQIFLDLGVGAKTNVGYGVMQIVSEQEKEHTWLHCISEKSIQDIVQAGTSTHNNHKVDRRFNTPNNDNKKSGTCRLCGKPTSINKKTGKLYDICYACFKNQYHK